jgi:hypothetical protein
MNFPLSSSNARRTSAAPAQSVSVSNSAGSIVPRIVLRGLFGTVGTKSSAADHDAEHCREGALFRPLVERIPDTVKVVTRISLQKLPSDQLIDFRFA